MIHEFHDYFDQHAMHITSDPLSLILNLIRMSGCDTYPT